jgi:hypothetical protein
MTTAGGRATAGARTERHPIPANARKADTRPNNLLRSYS